MKSVKKNLCLVMFFTSSAMANDDAFIRYFNDFHHDFSPASMSEDSYKHLVSFREKPSHFVNYSKDAVESYTGESDDPRVIADKNEILFNGLFSKRFFLKYIKEVALSDARVSALSGYNVEYELEGATYTFKISEKGNDKVVLYENILFPVGDDNYSEHSCFYDFSKSGDGVITLTDVACAG